MNFSPLTFGRRAKTESWSTSGTTSAWFISFCSNCKYSCWRFVASVSCRPCFNMLSISGSLMHDQLKLPPTFVESNAASRTSNSPERRNSSIPLLAQ